jgi:hypothetical protein
LAIAWSSSPAFRSGPAGAMRAIRDPDFSGQGEMKGAAFKRLRDGKGPGTYRLPESAVNLTLCGRRACRLPPSVLSGLVKDLGNSESRRWRIWEGTSIHEQEDLMAKNRNKSERNDENVPRGDHASREASGSRSEGERQSSSRQGGRQTSSRQESDRQGGDRQGSDKSSREGMGASDRSERGTSDRVSGRSAEESDSEERNSGAKPGWDDRSSEL